MRERFEIDPPRTPFPKQGIPGKIIANERWKIGHHRGTVQASQAGVEIDLIVADSAACAPDSRASATGPDHQHHRAVLGTLADFYFFSSGEEEYYIGSADWMSRNLDNGSGHHPHRGSALRQELREFLDLLSDNRKAWDLLSDGTTSSAVPRGEGEEAAPRNRVVDLTTGGERALTRPPAAFPAPVHLHVVALVDEQFTNASSASRGSSRPEIIASRPSTTGRFRSRATSRNTSNTPIRGAGRFPRRSNQGGDWPIRSAFPRPPMA